MKTKLLLGFSLLLIPFMAYADNEEVQFALINSSSSLVPKPIHVTAGYISYNFMPNGTDEVPAGCPTWDNQENVNLATIVNLPLPILPVSFGKEATFTFHLPSSMAACFKGSISAIVQLSITEIDGIKKQEGTSCGVYTYVNPTYSIGHASINIIKTDGNFYCNAVAL